MAEKLRHSLGEIKANGGYRLGMVEASLKLPKMRTQNPDGTEVAFKAEQNHIPYLRRSNEFPMLAILESQGSVYGKIPTEDGRVILVAGTSSPYILEGEHVILWALSGDNFRFQPNITFIPDSQGRKLFSTIANTAEIFSNKGLSFFIGVNSNDKEYQRQSVQSIRDGAHVHCVGISTEDIHHLEPIKPDEDKRILDDPFSLLSNRLLEKIVIPRIFGIESANDLVTGIISAEDYPYKYPKGTSLVLRDGLDTLRNPAFFSFVQKIHQIMQAEYNELISCFTDGRYETFRTKVDDDIDTISFFRRPLLLPKEQILGNLAEYFEKHPELKGDVLVENGMRYLARVLKSASQVVEENINEKDKKLNIPIVSAKTMNSKIIMDGLSYNTLIFPHPETGVLLLTIVPRVTTGGSPLDSFGIKKDQYSVSKKEFEEHMIEMDTRVDITVARLFEMDEEIVAGSAFKGVPKTPKF